MHLKGERRLRPKEGIDPSQLKLLDHFADSVQRGAARQAAIYILLLACICCGDDAELLHESERVHENAAIGHLT